MKIVKKKTRAVRKVKYPPPYKSELEWETAKLLEKEGIWFEYEALNVVFMKGYKRAISYEKVGKKFKECSAVKKLSYTPDFVGKSWVIETKGHITEAFRIRWKLFKQWVDDNGKGYTLFMPTNMKEVAECIKIIKEKELWKTL